MSSKYAFAQALREVRFLMCQSSEQSAATRNFLTRAYPIMKKNNPHIPIMIREAQGAEPRVFARFGLGKEQQESLSGLNDAEIEQRVTSLVTRTSS